MCSISALISPSSSTCTQREVSGVRRFTCCKNVAVPACHIAGLRRQLAQQHLQLIQAVAVRQRVRLVRGSAGSLAPAVGLGLGLGLLLAVGSEKRGRPAAAVWVGARGG